MVRSSRDGKLPEWLTGGYYLNSTMYKLILPAALLRLMQKQVTFVDLTLDKTIKLRYLLLKLYSRSFTDDFEFAKINPVLKYDPNNLNWAALRKQDPGAYTRQALVLGDLENICDALLIKEADTPPYVMSFGEFEYLVENGDAVNRESLKKLTALLYEFSCTGRPVLARMLTAQAVMAELILSAYDHKTTVEDLQKRLRAVGGSSAIKAALAWSSEAAADEELQVVQQYWTERLNWLLAGSSWIESDGSDQESHSSSPTE
jgi:hypothetical protein